MSNYITIEYGYYEPFKENETDPELKIWADKYFEIIKRIHEVLLPYNERYEHFEELSHGINELANKIDFFCRNNRYILSCTNKEDQIRELLLQSSFIEKMNSLFEDNEMGFLNSPDYNNVGETQDLLWRFRHRSDFFSFARKYLSQFNPFDNNFANSQKKRIEKDLFELKEELRKCLLHRVWKCRDSMLINESNVFSVIFNGTLQFNSGMWIAEVYPFRKPDCYRVRDRKYLKREDDSDTYGMTYSIIEDIKTMGTTPLTEGFMGYLMFDLSVFDDIPSECSIVETYKDFQSGNIDKIIKDKIKCGGYRIYSDFHCRY